MGVVRLEGHFDTVRPPSNNALERDTMRINLLRCRSSACSVRDVLLDTVRGPGGPDTEELLRKSVPKIYFEAPRAVYPFVAYLLTCGSGVIA